jgi:hypothetical protein
MGESIREGHIPDALSATPSKIIVAFNLIASASRFRLWTGLWG